MTPPRPPLRALLRVPAKAKQRCTQRRCIFWRNQHANIAQNLRQTVDIGSDHRNPRRHPLQRSQAEALPAAGNDEDVGVRQQRGDIVALAQPLDGGAAHVLHAPALRSTRDPQGRPVRQASEQHVKAFLRDVSPQRQQSRPRTRTESGRRAHRAYTKPAEINPVRDHHRSRVHDALDLHRVAPTRFRDVGDAARELRERSFYGSVTGLLVAVHVVFGGDRWPPREPRGRAPPGVTGKKMRMHKIKRAAKSNEPGKGRKPNAPRPARPLMHPNASRLERGPQRAAGLHRRDLLVDEAGSTQPQHQPLGAPARQIAKDVQHSHEAQPLARVLLNVLTLLPLSRACARDTSPLLSFRSLPIMARSLTVKHEEKLGTSSLLNAFLFLTFAWMAAGAFFASMSDAEAAPSDSAADSALR